MSTLEDLVAATPVPPDDIGELIAGFEAMRVARQQILDGLAAPIEVAKDDARLAVLAERNAAWHRALERALGRVASHRLNTATLKRAYGGTRLR